MKPDDGDSEEPLHMTETKQPGDGENPSVNHTIAYFANEAEQSKAIIVGAVIRVVTRTIGHDALTKRDTDFIGDCVLYASDVTARACLVAVDRVRHGDDVDTASDRLQTLREFLADRYGPEYGSDPVRDVIALLSGNAGDDVAKTADLFGDAPKAAGKPFDWREPPAPEHAMPAAAPLAVEPAPALYPTTAPARVTADDGGVSAALGLDAAAAGLDLPGDPEDAPAVGEASRSTGMAPPAPPPMFNNAPSVNEAKRQALIREGASRSRGVVTPPTAIPVPADAHPDDVAASIDAAVSGAITDAH